MEKHGNDNRQLANAGGADVRVGQIWYEIHRVKVVWWKTEVFHSNEPYDFNMTSDIISGVVCRFLQSKKANVDSGRLGPFARPSPGLRDG
jgi:hypothetical protein